MDTDEKHDHLTVRIKHHGQCQSYKGHFDIASFLGGMAITVSFFLGTVLFNHMYQ